MPSQPPLARRTQDDTAIISSSHKPRKYTWPRIQRGEYIYIDIYIYKLFEVELSVLLYMLGGDTRRNPQYRIYIRQPAERKDMTAGEDNRGQPRREDGWRNCPSGSHLAPLRYLWARLHDENISIYHQIRRIIRSRSLSDRT